MPQLHLPALLSHPEKAIIVTDSYRFVQMLSEMELDALLLGTLERLPAYSLALPFSFQGARQFYERAARTPCKQSLLCPLYAFSPSLENALYSLMLLLRCDFADCLTRQRDYLKRLARQPCLRLAGRGVQAEVQLLNRCTPYVTTRDELQDSFILSISELFEVHYAHMRPDSPDLFRINGQLHVSGLLASRTSGAGTASGGLEEPLQRLLGDVAQHGAWLQIQDNRVCSFKVAGDERLRLLQQIVGPRGVHLSEFAIGVNAAIAPNLDYRVNSPVNEGISGVHVALGDGNGGYHIDFLSPGAQVLPG